jgi:pre-60S factor REI1
MLTSTTAPGKTFASRSELADHYKSDWHKYNLKRREAGLALLEEVDFMARWEAALALRKEKDAHAAHSGTDHLKHKRASAQKHLPSSDKKTMTNNNNDDDNDNEEKEEAQVDTSIAAPVGKQLPAKLVESQENPTIDPNQSLFDNHMSKTLEENVEYMHLKFGFFIPDRGRFVACCLLRAVIS